MVLVLMLLVLNLFVLELLVLVRGVPFQFLFVVRREGEAEGAAEAEGGPQPRSGRGGR